MPGKTYFPRKIWEKIYRKKMLEGITPNSYECGYLCMVMLYDVLLLSNLVSYSSQILYSEHQF